MLFERNGRADRARAEELLASARATSDDLGMNALGAKVRTLLDTAARRRPSERHSRA
jgi:hypothetical protein